MKENSIHINAYIALKLENDKTIIYINGKKFRHCKALIFNLAYERLSNIENTKSIDEFKKSHSSSVLRIIF